MVHRTEMEFARLSTVTPDGEDVQHKTAGTRSFASPGRRFRPHANIATMLDSKVFSSGAGLDEPAVARGQARIVSWRALLETAVRMRVAYILA
jgi:hypothetical protein